MPKREKVRQLRALWGVIAALAVVGPGALVPSHAAPSRSELNAAKDRLLELERDFELVVEEYNAVNEHLEDVQARISDVERVVDELETRMTTRQEDAAALAQELYKSGGTGGMEAVLSSDSLAEIDARMTYIETSEEANTEVFQRLAADRSALDDKLEELADAEEEAAADKSRLADLRADIDAKLADQKDEIDELTAVIERAERRAAAREAAAEETAEPPAAPAPPTDGHASPSPARDPARAPAPSSGAQIAVDAALSQVGKTYVWGAEGPDSYDCSGLTLWAWAHAGVSLPHNSQMQYDATARVERSDWQPGDLLFYGSPIHHVAMYIGNGQMVEAPYSGSQVRVVSAYRSDYVGAGRP